MEKSAVTPVRIRTAAGEEYTAWKIKLTKITYIFTLAELARAQERGCAYERDVTGRVAKQSITREVTEFDGMYGDAIDAERGMP